jgi:hypothetical protein
LYTLFIYNTELNSILLKNVAQWYADKACHCGDYAAMEITAGIK